VPERNRPLSSQMVYFSSGSMEKIDIHLVVCPSNMQSIAKCHFVGQKVKYEKKVINIPT
jgi:hypothetical protein